MAPRHAPAKKQRSTKTKVLGLGALGLALLIAVAAVVVVATRPSSTPSVVTPSQGAGPFSVLAATPSNSALVNSTAAIRISLSAPLDLHSPLPIVSPAVPGSWQRLSSSTLEFVQLAAFAPGEAVTVTIPGGSSGLLSSSGARLASTVTTSFQISQLSLLRVQQLLAEEGYLPVTFTPAGLDASSQPATSDEVGSFSPRWSSMPASLTAGWEPGVENVVTRGAVMRFEDVHHLPTDGTIDATFEADLLADRAAGTSDPDPYNYVSVSKALPETLTLYSDGQVVYTTLVNTGIPGQDTADGTYPVYLRYVTTTMSGLNPDGTPYHDTGIPWTSYFNGGDALHGFIRPGYGWPQSLGCVEMAFDNAHVVWNQTPIGTLVTVA
jgi:lipoprotein-anchoring transpeptidase ErfK/SrfK